MMKHLAGCSTFLRIFSKFFHLHFKLKTQSDCKKTKSQIVKFFVLHAISSDLLSCMYIVILCCSQAAVKCASSPRTNALSTKPRLPLAALAADAARIHPPNNVNSHVSNIQEVYLLSSMITLSGI